MDHIKKIGIQIVDDFVDFRIKLLNSQTQISGFRTVCSFKGSDFAYRLLSIWDLSRRSARLRARGTVHS